MKRIILFHLIIIFCFTSCEILNTDEYDWRKTKFITSPDDTSIPDSIKKLIWIDAATLALRDLIKDPEAKYNLVEIPNDLIELYYRGLVHIYNARKYSPFDKISNIHVFPEPTVSDIVILFDTTYVWTLAWKRGERLTGNSEIDSLMENYNLQLHSCHFDIAALYSPDPVNTYALSKLFVGVDGIRISEPNGYMGDGNNIQAEILKSHLSYTFSVGWGDCPSGCISRHFWEVNVEYNGTVKMIKEYGDPLP